MRLLSRLSLLLLLPLAGVAQQTVVVTSSGGAGGLGLYSDGSSWSTSGGFTFEVGVFPAGFDPASSERATWLTAWMPVNAATTGAVNTWFKDGASTYFSITGSSSALRTAESVGVQYYVWGYNTKTVGLSAEWVLLTNPAWRLVSTTTPRLPDLFDTKDTGTLAVVGTLSNSGKDLQSAKIFASGLAISALASSFTVPVGQSATLSVTATGSGLTYQWYVGAKGDTSTPIVGATRSIYTAGAVTATTRFWVRISDGVRTIDSEAITVTASGSGTVVNATHAVASLGYIAGERVAIRNRISYSGALNSLEIEALLPAGWSYVGGDIPGAQTQPAAGDTDVLRWTWTSVPSGSFTFTYVISVPAGTSGDQVLASIVNASKDSVSYQSLSQSDPLVLRAGPRFHSADINRDGQLGVGELTRVIQLYNTRLGTVRTGAYRVNASSEDGFDPDFSSSTASPLTSYHTADNNPADGRVSLEELTRVIELYNTRVGTIRTGAYHARGDTQDGFVSGTAP